MERFTEHTQFEITSRHTSVHGCRLKASKMAFKRQLSLNEGNIVSESECVRDAQQMSGCSHKRPKLTESATIQIEVKLRSESKAKRNDSVTAEEGQGTSALSASMTFPETAPTFRSEPEAINPFNTAIVPDVDQRSVTQNFCDEESSSDELDEDQLSLEDEPWNGSEFDEFAEFAWLEQMDDTVTCEGATAAYCNAKLIRRDQVRSDFYEEVEQPSQETSKMAFDLFDRYGRLKMEFQAHPFLKGSGVWQDELNDGDILLIEDIRVDERYRRQKLASKLLQAVLDKARTKSRKFFALALPEPITAELDRQISPP
jgi:GNAT superfamily N-acetyltransferase